MIKIVAFDLETPQDNPEFGLQPWRLQSKEAVIQTFASWTSAKDTDLCKAITRPTKRQLSEFILAAAEKGYVIAGWNLMFDVSWLVAAGLIKDLKKCQFLDGMLMLKHMNPWMARQYGGPGFGLKAAVGRRWPDRADYDSGVDVTKVPETANEWKDMLRYNIQDSMYSALLIEGMIKELSRSELNNCLIEAGSLPDVAKSYIHGIHISPKALKPLRDAVDIAEGEALPIFGAPLATVRSPKKLADLLFDDWEYDPLEMTEAGNRSTDKETLMKLAIQHPEDERFAALMKLRKCNTRRSKFINATLKSVEYHGEYITRPEPAISGTMTGRFTYTSRQGRNKGTIQTGIALHQWERDKETRALLCAPPGFFLVEFDFSGQEMRLMAILSGDEVMLDMFESGLDGHALMGSRLEGVDYDWVTNNADSDKNAKAVRDLGKFCVAKGELVLTDRGLVPIQDVALDMKVWDGMDWVTHDGSIFQGYANVINYDGIRLTADHYVYCKGQHAPKRFYDAASEGLQLTTSGDGGREVSLVHDHLSRSGTQQSKRGFGKSPVQMRSENAQSNEQSVSGKSAKGMHSLQQEEPEAAYYTSSQPVAVYDVINAGPNCRYTVSDKLICNSNLSLQYRIGKESIMSRALTQYGMRLTLQKAEHIKRTYLQTYKQIPVYWRNAQTKSANDGYARTMGGRRIPLSNLTLYPQQQTAINYPIQGTGGDMKSLALAVCRPLFDNSFIYAWDLHDALFVYVKNDRKALGRMAKMQNILNKLPYRKAWGWDPTIPLPVDAKYGRSWGDLKPLE